MKWLAVAIFPSKEERLLISYTELEALWTKDEIRVWNNTTISVQDQWKETVTRLVHEYIEKVETVVPIVFWMHALFRLTTEKLYEAAKNVLGNLPTKSELHCRTFYPLRDLSEEKVGEERMYAMNRAFWGEIDFDTFTPEQDRVLERIAKLWTSVLEENSKESRFVWILPDDRYLITQILKKWWKWRERFGTHVCRYLWTKRNICVKPLWVNPNPPFSDVTATYIADILDQKTWDAPRIVEAIR